jgi:hypothetical protein
MQCYGRALRGLARFYSLMQCRTGPFAGKPPMNRAGAPADSGFVVVSLIYTAFFSDFVIGFSFRGRLPFFVTVISLPAIR